MKTRNKLHAVRTWLPIIIAVCAWFIVFDEVNAKVTEHTGRIQYHWYEGGRTAVGISGNITEIVDPPVKYGFEVGNKSVYTNKRTWYLYADGKTITYTERKDTIRDERNF